MNRYHLKQRLKRIIAEAIEIDPGEIHRCIDGSEATLDSPKCLMDIQYRIEDAAASRDSCSTRTDARMHYNGLLNVLRRKLRQSQKVQLEDHI